ncbi:UDP-N-acetylmuramoyl-tripeptide--D-alanyl-D-alanine ligase [Vibrio rumoiensis]|uniref:UDP-N-acetylmuramoyl-tripeptide--D-alanyl-D-alanine ligase n=1 Tax=Vibrio rumoiensis 1S-45 TaxID=1188252 RepID=A0A1E5E1G3_9VIBR|nr:UDP-N-acetylmuramoyl-tripeptide--D-alanyl-D-alanine ligase [Vibrio rumoiensis]OEF24982.1 UDP-N-acetylmuramoyl-tripeptide--D-alanyl-D-alanine ligase [Vibrio rumoiensis 1S-45]
MIPFSLQQLAEITGGKLSGENIEISSVTTDTRQVESGALFIALIGERFDAHDFCQQALEQGASALLVSKHLPLDISQVLVDDTQKALGKLAQWVHQQSKAMTLALTGSCGKTTVKEMLAAILNQKGQVLSTAGNFNNEIGVPLTLLRSQLDDEFAVIELGANHLGEIAYTTELVRPSIALVNNIGESHLEGFGSIEGVAQAKGEIFQGLPQGGTAVINLDSNGMTFWEETLADKCVVTFSVVDPNADYFSQDIQVNHQGQASFTLVSPLGKKTVCLPMIGKHNISNALAASAMAVQAGATLDEIVSGLQVAHNVKGRVEAIDLTNNIRLIDDSYNASVPAMKAAADLLANYVGKRWFILGYMAELGEESQALHYEVGQHTAQFNFDYVLTFGEDTAIISQLYANAHTSGSIAQHFDTHEAMISFIKQHLSNSLQDTQAENKHTLLIKGANSSRMSLVVAALKENYA